jgi:hypothetical protein
MIADFQLPIADFGYAAFADLAVVGSQMSVAYLGVRVKQTNWQSAIGNRQ